MDDYTTIREGAALVSGDPRARIAVSGKDRASYLQGLLTNDIQALTAGSGCYSAWLTPQGRMITDLHVLESGDMILLDIPAALREQVLQRLDQFIFSEDVQLGDLTDALRAVSLHGPRAASVVASVVSGIPNAGEWAQYQNARAEWAGTTLVIARIDQLGVPGFTIYVDSAREADLVAALERHGARRVGQDAADAARVEAGYPLFGIDMDDDIIPLEAGIEPRAISFSKGCYVGQEVIIRVVHRGHGRVARRLVGLRLENGGSLARGARIHAGGKDAGFVTSTAQSPRFGTIALGYVHRDFVAPGTSVEIETGTGRTGATVSALPFA
jgi:folate-binding protein YgfZ